MARLWSNAINLFTWGLIILALLVWAARAFELSDDRAGLVRRWIYSVVLVGVMLWILSIRSPIKYLLYILPFLALAFIWLPSVTGHFLKPLLGEYDGSNEEVKRKPFYFMAEGKRQKGQYAEAMEEVRKQLEMFPGDHEGYMKLAAIEMENLKDLPAAQATLNEFIELSNIPNEKVSTLHLLADWQLQHGRSAQAASATLQRIVDLYPDSPFAHSAQKRMSHLVTADEATQARHFTKFTVKPGVRDVGLIRESAPEAPPPDPHALAAEYVKQLESHPLDTEVREKLALLYASDFQRVDLATDQLEQLIALPAEKPKQIAHWLNLLATLHIKHAYNLEAAQDALRRIPEKFPGGALADVANRRLASLNSELKASQQTAPKALGNYEKDAGLKRAGG